MFYYEIQSGSAAYRKICDCLRDYLKWFDDSIQEQIRRLLSIESVEGIHFVPGRLIMDNPPDHLKKYFDGPNEYGQYTALIDSDLNNKWVRFCRENDLKFIRPSIIMDYDFGLIEYPGKKIFYLLGSKFIIESEVELDKGFLKTIPKTEFIRLKADFLAKQGKIA
ncbi:hypothetical protein IT084_15740 [Desulfallas sp. Bu1-1]|uniref:hypothetical protein n=1 Tax=Desulfallas sp. Bu1-1 TaxID=2787620 RepID=UPI00189F8965|nr:hypothetical protein [Desulfallas sp. Bu1-1]MBF7084405.1 hypothetical protein [Desulfallas sp. Bu1-1]